MNILITILKYALTCFLGLATGHCIIKFFVARKLKNGKHYCNNCNIYYGISGEPLNYLFSPFCGEPRDYLYCPFCGEQLDYHEKDERSRAYQAQRRYGDNDE